MSITIFILIILYIYMHILFCYQKCCMLYIVLQLTFSSDACSIPPRELCQPKMSPDISKCALGAHNTTAL